MVKIAKTKLMRATVFPQSDMAVFALRESLRLNRSEMHLGFGG